jgi:hypothetical protein
MTSMFAGEHIKNIAVPTAPLLRDTIIGQISLKIGLASEFPIQKSFHDGAHDGQADGQGLELLVLTSSGDALDTPGSSTRQLKAQRVRDNAPTESC